MAQDGFPLSITLKAGTDFSAPWIVVYGHSPDEVTTKLNAIIDGELIHATIVAANPFKAANNAAPLVSGGQEAAAAPQQAPAQPAQQSAWGQQPQQQAAPQQGGNRFGGEQHPEGKACHCGKVLEMKKTQSGKPTWQCPDWRWNGGNPNGHDMEWVNSR